ncbi:MAG TPA: sulfatase-like hydrolase/transferase [Thermoanaerobaculia bacterium]|nr:sulfatase-like hydrolase/transferase [Thermoanaerobaculia bacterium]
MRPGSLRGSLPALLLGGLLLASCRGAKPPELREGPPIVLITFDSLRADVVGGLGGEPGLTPNLDALLRGADWGGRAVAPSSLGATSMASLLTGLRPWQHQVLHDRQAHLSKALLTLPEALKAAGYTTAGFSGEASYSKDFGYDQGFDQLEALEKGTAALDRLRALRGRQFVWIHIPEPSAPYLRRPNFENRIDTRGLDLPPRVQPNELEPFFDPAVPLPPELRQRFWAMYRLNAAFADDRLGRFLQALRESGQWDRTLLVVTSTHGEELGEKHQILNGGNLGRQLLEVPLAVKLPAGSGHRIAVPKGQRPAAARIWATVVEASGGLAPPAVAPSLFHELRGTLAAVLSELYCTNGTNQFSLLDGDDQLLRESRFAPPQPEYYRARLAEMGRGNAEVARSLLSEPPEAIFGRLLAAFRSTLPLTGRGAPKLTLERWGAGSGSVPLSNPRRTAELDRYLVQRWNEFLPGETTPEAEAREWYTAELH